MNSKLKNIYLFLTITLTMASVHAMGPLGWLCGGGGSCRSKSKANSMGESVAYTVDNSQQSKDISYLASPIAPVLMQRSRVDDDNDDEGEVQQQQQRRQDSSAASEYDEYEDDEFSSVERFVDDDSRHHLTSLQLYKMAFDADRPEYSKYFHVPGNLAVHSTPFHVEGRYVLDLQGRRVKFACINWPAHGPWLLPEGLSQYSVNQLARRARLLGFNCVRYVIGTELLDRLDGPALQKQPQGNRRLSSLIQRIIRHNPQLDDSDFTLLNLMDSAMEALANENLFVMLDVRRSPTAAAAAATTQNDTRTRRSQKSVGEMGNYLTHLESVAQLCATRWPNVVGLGVGSTISSQSIDAKEESSGDWLQRMRWAATSIAAQNPFLLISIAGRREGMDLTAIAELANNQQPFVTEQMHRLAPLLKKRILFELRLNSDNFMSGHSSSPPSPGTPPLSSPSSSVTGDSAYDSDSAGYSSFFNCPELHRELNHRGGFLLDKRLGPQMVSPVWLSELGVDAYSFSRIVPPQSFSDDEDVVESDSPKSPLTAQRLKRGKQWLKCMAKWILLKDADVGYWALNSIYYESEGNASRSSWGLLADKGGHSHVKNQQLMDVLHAFMLVSEGPGVNSSPLLPTLPKDMSEFLKREKEQRLIAHFGSTDLLHLHSSFRPRRAERAY